MEKRRLKCLIDSIRCLKRVLQSSILPTISDYLCCQFAELSLLCWLIFFLRVLCFSCDCSFVSGPLNHGEHRLDKYMWCPAFMCMLTTLQSVLIYIIYTKKSHKGRYLTFWIFISENLQYIFWQKDTGNEQGFQLPNILYPY